MAATRPIPSAVDIDSFGAIAARVKGLGEETHVLRDDIRHIRSEMVTRSDFDGVTASIGALATKIDQAARDGQPNLIGMICAACAAIGISLTIGGGFATLWKSSVDDRFMTVIGTIREMRADLTATDKDIRGAMLTRDEYKERAATEIARREAALAIVRDEMRRQDEEITRIRNNLVTRSEHERVWGEQVRNRDRQEQRLNRLEERQFSPR